MIDGIITIGSFAGGLFCGWCYFKSGVLQGHKKKNVVEPPPEVSPGYVARKSHRKQREEWLESISDEITRILASGDILSVRYRSDDDHALRMKVCRFYISSRKWDPAGVTSLQTLGPQGDLGHLLQKPEVFDTFLNVMFRDISVSKILAMVRNDIEKQIADRE